MSMPPHLSGLSGEWKGTKRLYLNGESGPEQNSPSRLTIAGAARATFMLLDYTWKYESEAQEGVLLLGYDDGQNIATAAWGDSWHMNQKVMLCVGVIDIAGNLDVRGSYAAPPGPDWGWRIALVIHHADSIGIVMHNVAPDGQEELAVQAEFVRVG